VESEAPTRVESLRRAVGRFWAKKPQPGYRPQLWEALSASRRPGGPLRRRDSGVECRAFHRFGHMAYVPKCHTLWGEAPPRNAPI